MIDFGALFSQLLSDYWWALPLFALAALLKSPWFKGFIGEVMVNIAALLFLALTKPVKGHARECILGGLLVCTGQDK